MGRGTIGVVRDVLGDQRGGPGQVGGTSLRYGTGRGTLGEVQDGSGDPRRGPGRVGGPSGRSGTC